MFWHVREALVLWGQAALDRLRSSFLGKLVRAARRDLGELVGVPEPLLREKRQALRDDHANSKGTTAAERGRRWPQTQERVHGAALALAAARLNSRRRKSRVG